MQEGEKYNENRGNISRSRYLSRTWDSSERGTGSKRDLSRHLIPWSNAPVCSPEARIYLFQGGQLSKGRPNRGNFDRSFRTKRKKKKRRRKTRIETNHLRHLLSQLIACSTRKSMPRSLERNDPSRREDCYDAYIESGSRHLRRTSRGDSKDFLEIY